MSNAPLPQAIPAPADRRRRSRYRVVSSAMVKPLASNVFEAECEQAHPLNQQIVVVHDVSLGGVGMRSRLPLDICSQYSIECEDQNVYLRAKRMRVISCRRGQDGMYEIGAQLC